MAHSITVKDGKIVLVTNTAGYINNPNSREEAVNNITWYLNNKLWSEDFKQENLNKLKAMIKD